MSDQSPWQPPQETSQLDSADKGQAVRQVARYQRWVIFALLFNIGATVVSVLANLGMVPIPATVILVASLGGMVFSMFAIFMLAKELSGVALGILCAILMFAPCISLLVLLILNQKATTFLQNNGVRVGFLGVNPDSI